MKLPFTVCPLIVAMLTACGGGGSSSSTGSGGGDVGASSSIPRLAEWEQNMVTYGRQHCNQSQIAELSTWEGSIWYYDGIRTYYQISDYTGDSSWNDCAGYVWDVYGNYVLDSGGKVPGWRVFPHGLAEDFERTGREASRTAALSLASNSAFASQGGGPSFELSRETAYLIHAYLTAEELGASENPLLSQSVTYALGHIDQWAVSESAAYVKPFMVGLTMEALIRYYERTGDARIPDAIRHAADWLWGHAWNSDAQAFVYIVCKPQAVASNGECTGRDAGPAPDLNLLIAPAYAWLYHHFGESQYRNQGDAIFAGGVGGAYLQGGKQFNQSYRWSFDFVKWRGR